MKYLIVLSLLVIVASCTPNQSEQLAFNTVETVEGCDCVLPIDVETQEWCETSRGILVCTRTASSGKKYNEYKKYFLPDPPSNCTEDNPCTSITGKSYYWKLGRIGKWNRVYK